MLKTPLQCSCQSGLHAWCQHSWASSGACTRACEAGTGRFHQNSSAFHSNASCDTDTWSALGSPACPGNSKHEQRGREETWLFSSVFTKRPTGNATSGRRFFTQPLALETGGMCPLSWEKSLPFGAQQPKLMANPTCRPSRDHTDNFMPQINEADLWGRHTHTHAGTQVH